VSEDYDILDQCFPDGIILDSKENEDAMWDKFFPSEMATQLKSMNTMHGDNK